MAPLNLSLAAITPKCFQMSFPMVFSSQGTADIMLRNTKGFRILQDKLSLRSSHTEVQEFVAAAWQYVILVTVSTAKNEIENYRCSIPTLSFMQFVRTKTESESPPKRHTSPTVHRRRTCVEWLVVLPWLPWPWKIQAHLCHALQCSSTLPWPGEDIGRQQLCYFAQRSNLGACGPSNTGNSCMNSIPRASVCLSNHPTGLWKGSRNRAMFCISIFSRSFCSLIH